MKKTERLKEIETFWKSRDRDHKWQDIQWEPFVRQGESTDIKSPEDIHLHLKTWGNAYWTMGLFEVEGRDCFDWEWILLDMLNAWYSLPETCEAPLFINEKATTIWISVLNPAEIELLFSHLSSTALGMQNWELKQREFYAEEYERKKARRIQALASQAQLVESFSDVLPAREAK
jgi:hypothetical protein